jgi:hypothetical protein
MRHSVVHQDLWEFSDIHLLPGRPAVQCSAVRCSAVQCNARMVQLAALATSYLAVLSMGTSLLVCWVIRAYISSILPIKVQCSAVQCSEVRCSAVQWSAEEWSAVQCSAVQCSAVQCSAVQCSLPPAERVHPPRWSPLPGHPSLHHS